jgi:hypothetical protein
MLNLTTAGEFLLISTNLTLLVVCTYETTFVLNSLNSNVLKQAVSMFLLKHWLFCTLFEGVVGIFKHWLCA